MMRARPMLASPMLTTAAMLLLPVASLAQAIDAPTIDAPVIGPPVIDAPPPPTATEATQLQAQVRAWLHDVTGGSYDPPADAVTFKPEGAGYLITVPIGAAPQVEPKSAVITARAHRLDAARWAIDDQQLPPELTITVQQPLPTTEPAPRAEGAKPPLPKPGVKPVAQMRTITYRIKLGAQAAAGTFDPTYRSASTMRGTIASIDLVQTGMPIATISHFGTIVTNSTTSPDAAGHVSVALDSLIDTYESKREGTPGSGITLTAQHVHVVNRIDGFARDRWGAFVAAAIQAGKTVQPAPPNAGATPAAVAKARERAMQRALLVAAHGLLTGGSFEQTADTIHFDADGHTGGLSHAVIGITGDAPQDALTAGMTLTLDGLVVDELPPAFAAYLPSHFTIHPVIANLSTVALTKAGMDGTAPGSNGPPDEDFAALFEHGGIELGFDALGLDIGSTKLTGSGHFTATGPQTVTGQAEVTATDLDALITHMQADPAVAQILPFAIFLKGIAKTDGGRSSWQISLADHKTLVNGIDLAALGGAVR